jgi:predicted dehydrogenase
MTLDADPIDEKLKVGIIGTGIGSILHFPAFKLNPYFEPVKIAGRDKEKTKTIAKGLKSSYTTDWETVVKDPEIDVISIATPPAVHEEIVLSAIENEKYILCEKPLSNNIASAQNMSDVVEESGIPSMVNYEFRYIPSRAYLIELLKSRYVGDIHQVHLKINSNYRMNPRKQGYNWWSDASLGGGMLSGLGSHYIDFLCTIFDNIDKVSGKLFTHYDKRFNKATGRMRKVTSDDAFSCRLDIDDKIQCTMNLSSTIGFENGTLIEFHGNEGSLVIRDEVLIGGKIGESNQLQSIAMPSTLSKYAKQSHPLVSPMAALLDDFAKGIFGGVSSHPNFQDALKVEKVISSLRKSNKSGKWISVN